MKLLAGLLLLLADALPAQSLRDLATQTGARVFWEPYRELALFSDARHRLTVDVATGLALGDGERVFELTGLDPVTGEMGTADYQRLLAWWKDQSPPASAAIPEAPRPSSPPGSGPRVQVLVLDAGHGGSDPGSIGRHTIDGRTSPWPWSSNSRSCWAKPTPTGTLS